jgi:vacuolar-type H+-ATPase subunit I/STV1
LSTLGKILTVLVALASVAVAVLVAREFVLSQDWRAAAQNWESNYTGAVKEVFAAVDQRDKDRADHVSEKARMEENINVLSTNLDNSKKAIVSLNADKENQDKRLAELAANLTGLDTSLKALLAEKKNWQDERDRATKTSDEYTKMYAELEAKYRNAVADLQNIRESLRLAREEKAALESRIAWINANYPEVKMPAQVPAVPTVKVDGLVTQADNEAKVATVNVGTDRGVVKGMKFFVYNGSEMKYLATLTINMVSATSAAGELNVIRGTVKVNDHVTNRFE